MTDWQPIETAPADTRILCFQDGFIYIGEKDTDDGQWWTDEDRFNPDDCRPPAGVDPTHWMPLPAPPSATAKR